LIQSRSSAVPSVHTRLSELIAMLGNRNLPRGKKPQKQLLLTMNIDLMTERALLQAGGGFTRGGPPQTEKELYVTDFHDQMFTAANPNRLDELIENANTTTLRPDALTGNVVEPILFKLRGSQDIGGSCALTRPQLLAQARLVIAERLIPA